jgi:lysyl-tRNA synthetase, class I
LREWSRADPNAQRNSPLEFVLQSDSARCFVSDLSFALILNLVATLGTTEFDLIWRYLLSYDQKIEGDLGTTKMIARLVECSINFYNDFVAPTKKKYTPTEEEQTQLIALKVFLDKNPDASAEQIEKAIYDIGRANYDKPGKIFPVIYRTLMGQERGPRLGTLFSIMKPFRVSEKIAQALQASLA